MIHRSVLFLALSSTLIAGSALAEIERQHAPHVHGVATGNLSIDNGDLRIELEIPGVNLIGFEHEPRTDEQQAALDGALGFLRVGEWVQADPRGGCELASVNAHTHGFGSNGDYDDHDHDNGHHHDHEHEHDHEHDDAHHHGGGDHDHHDDGHSHDHHHDHEHSEFHVIVGMECSHPERLRWVDLGLFDGYPGNERMEIGVLTPTVTTQANLTPSNPRIDLR